MPMTRTWRNTSPHPKKIAERGAPKGTPASEGGLNDVPSGLLVQPGGEVVLPGWVFFSCDFELVDDDRPTEPPEDEPAADPKKA